MFFIFFTNRIHKVLYKDILFSLDSNALQIDHVTSVECGREDDPNTVFDFEELDPVDYEINPQGDTIYVQVKKELITGYTYHFKVTVSLTQGKGDKVFETTILPRGIYSHMIHDLNFYFFTFYNIHNELKQWNKLFCHDK